MICSSSPLLVERDTQISKIVGIPTWLLTGQGPVSLAHSETSPMIF